MPEVHIAERDAVKALLNSNSLNCYIALHTAEHSQSIYSETWEGLNCYIALHIAEPTTHTLLTQQDRLNCYIALHIAEPYIF